MTSDDPKVSDCLCTSKVKSLLLNLHYMHNSSSLLVMVALIPELSVRVFVLTFAFRVRISPSSVYQAGDLYLLSAWEPIPTRGAFRRCLKTITPLVDPRLVS